MNQVDSRRIAKNTLLLYFRMFVMMILSLFTSRITLDVLGINDYGIYNVVGGVVSMFSVISGAITVAISRYITLEIGRDDIEQQRKVFSTSLIILIVLSFFIIFIAELAGVWFLNHKMVIPADRLYAANWVLQFSIVTFVAGLVSVPYNAVIVAHERMSAFAYITILDVVFKLLLVYALYITPLDKLIVYSFLLAFWAIILRFIYGFYCSRNFSETHFSWFFDKKLTRQMLGFIGWAFWGNGVVVLKDQGANVLLNLFCGPVVNAARGVALQVNNAVYNFVSNFMMAVNPQITKSYAQNDISNMNRLIMRSSKFSFFIMMILLLPICANVHYILNLWLVDVPEHTASFIVLTLLYSLLDCYGGPLITGVLADGNIKRYEIVLTLLYSLNFGASYLVLKIGLVPEYIFIMNIIFKGFIIVALVVHAHQRFYFPVYEYLKNSIIPTLLPFFLSGIAIYLLPITDANEFLSFVINSICVLGVSIFFICVLGISKGEYLYIVEVVKSKIYRG